MTAGQEDQFELPRNIEALLAALARHYQSKGEQALLKVVVNSGYEVAEGIDYDNWDGGQYGHGIRFLVPEPLYALVGELGDADARLREDLNRIASYPNEWVASVHLNPVLEGSASNWRRRSGALETDTFLHPASNQDLERLWGRGQLRIFLSHRAHSKVQAKRLRSELKEFAISAFVAHETIEPTLEWQTEIEKALHSMEVLVALITEGFRSSPWANQEVGVAIGRGLPIVALRLGEDPSGFIGRYQALRANPERPGDIASGLLGLLMEQPRLRPRLEPVLTQAWEEAGSYKTAIRILRILEQMTSLGPSTLSRLERAFEKNDQLYGCSTVRRDFPKFLARMKGTAA